MIDCGSSDDSSKLFHSELVVNSALLNGSSQLAQSSVVGINGRFELAALLVVAYRLVVHIRRWWL